MLLFIFERVENLRAVVSQTHLHQVSTRTQSRKLNELGIVNYIEVMDAVELHICYFEALDPDVRLALGHGENYSGLNLARSAQCVEELEPVDRVPVPRQ